MMNPTQTRYRKMARLNELYQLLIKPLERYLFSLRIPACHVSSMAHDVLANFLIVARYSKDKTTPPPSLDDLDAVQRYVWTSARTHAVDYYRAEQKAQTLFLDKYGDESGDESGDDPGVFEIPDLSQAPDKPILADELVEVVSTALNTLTDEEKIVIRKRYWENSSRRVIAEDLKLSIARVRYIETQALSKLLRCKKLRELDPRD